MELIFSKTFTINFVKNINKEEVAISIYLLDMQISVIIILCQVYMVWKVCKERSMGIIVEC